MTGSAIPSWINKGQPRSEWPEWLIAHAATKPEPNGSFLLRTKHGQARVHMRAMVFERKGVAYTCDPSEAKALLAELDAADAPPPAVPPAKASQGAAGAAVRRAVPKPTEQRSAAPRRRFAPPKGMPPSIENRHPSELKIDDSYQRSIDTGPSRALIKRIASEWDWRMCMPLVVSKREDGSLYVIDGQHRLAAAQMRGDIPFLPCCVAVYAGVADEAAMFVAMNRARRAMNRLDDFHAAQAGGDADALAVTAMIEAVGFSVSRKTGSASWAPGEVAFTSAIGRARRRHGEQVVGDALRMMADAFPGQRLVAGSSIFTALVAVLTDPPADFDRARLERALRTFDMAGWASFLSESKGGTDRHKHLREMLMEAYVDAGREGQQ
ncbi:MAG TPA: DUF6551 family protein [Sphingomonas sp.]|nr:DUF6551 family protein [Sphingomonas sp.]